MPLQRAMKFPKDRLLKDHSIYHHPLVYSSVVVFHPPTQALKAAVLSS